MKSFKMETNYSSSNSGPSFNENYNDTHSHESKTDSKSNSLKPRNNIKKIIHKIFQPGNSIQIKIKDMKLKEIPAQQTRIYVQAKVGHSKSGVKNSSRIQINEDNTVEWNDEMTLSYKLPFHSKEQKFLRRSLSDDFLSNKIEKEPYLYSNDSSNFLKENKHHSNNHKANHSPNGLIKIRPHLGHERHHTEKHSLKPYYIRFSIRLEDKSGRGHTRYGIAHVNMKRLKNLSNIRFQTELKYCNYKTIFSCIISIKSNRRSSCNLISHKQILSKVNIENERSYSDSLPSSKKVKDLNKNDRNNKSNEITESNDPHEWKLLSELVDQYTDNESLPFKIKSVKIDQLNQQVNDIIKMVMLEQNPNDS